MYFHVFSVPKRGKSKGFYMFLPMCMMEIWWLTKDVLADFCTSEVTGG